MRCLQLATISDDDLGTGLSTVGTIALHFLDDIQAFHNLSEDDVFAVQPVGKENMRGGKEKKKGQEAALSSMDPADMLMHTASAHHEVAAVQMKNWEPLVLGPALAMDRMPGPVCFRLKFSSSNLLP